MDASHIYQLAKAMRKGVKLLDRVTPQWRRVLRKHEATFNICQSRNCVLGTLGAHSLAFARRIGKVRPDYWDALAGLRFSLKRKHLDLVGWDSLGRSHGFKGDENDRAILDALWRAEFTK